MYVLINLRARRVVGPFSDYDEAELAIQRRVEAGSDADDWQIWSMG